MNIIYAMMDAQKRAVEIACIPFTMWVDYMIDQGLKQFK